MKLSQYRIIRSRKFPIRLVPPPRQPAQNLTTYALLSPYLPETYEIHISNNTSTQQGVIMFNDYECLKMGFNHVYQMQHDDDEQIKSELIRKISQTVIQNENNLIICNAVSLKPINEMIFTNKIQVSGRNSQSPTQNLLKTISTNLLTHKQKNTVITISILSIKPDGSLQDQFNYNWVNSSQYIEQIIKIKQKQKLKVKKYNSTIKTIDLNRQQINSWSECKQVLQNYFQIKQYIQNWYQQLSSKISPNIGEIYQFCQIQIQQKQAFIKQIHKRNCLIKFNQFTKQSNLVMMKLSKSLKSKVLNQQPNKSREIPLLLFLQTFFKKHQKSYFTIINQLGYNLTIKQQAKCLAMNLQIGGSYTYLKNYLDKPDLIKQVKGYATIYTPLTNQQRSSIKLTTVRNFSQKIRSNTLKIIKQSQAVRNKSFSFDTYSSIQKKYSPKNYQNKPFSKYRSKTVKTTERKMYKKCQNLTLNQYIF